MPHDINNQPMKVGDRVTIEFEVIAIHEGEEYCNCQLQSVEPMPPYKNEFIKLYSVNTHQTKLIRSLAEMNDDYPFACGGAMDILEDL